jgi:glycosyl transferase family 25
MIQELYVGILGLKSNFRGERLVNKVKALGITPEVTWGIPVAEIGVDRLLNYVNQEQARYISGRALTLQEISCALGHLEMYESFLISDKQFALFLEDDADFDGKLIELLKIDFSQKKPAVLQLAGYFSDKTMPFPFPVVFPKHREMFRHTSGILRCVRYPVGAFGYLMNRSAALKAVHLMRGRKINSPADFPFSWRTIIPFYITTEEIVWHNSTESNIESERSALEWEKGLPSKFERRLKLISSLSPIFLLRGKRLGLSGNAIIREKIFYYLISKYYTPAETHILPTTNER